MRASTTKRVVRSASTPTEELRSPPRVARHESVCDLGRSHVDADHLGNLGRACSAPQSAAGGCCGLGAGMPAEPAQLALGVRVDGAMGRLVRDVQFAVLGPHALECPRNLLRRPTPAQHVRYQRPQRAVGIELDRRPGRFATHRARLLRSLRGIATGLLFAPQFAAQAACAVHPSARLIQRRLLPCALSICSVTRSSGCNCWNLLVIFKPYLMDQVLHFRFETARPS